MYSKIRSLLALALISVTISACNVERIEVPADELYAREFIKQIGIIDSNKYNSLHTCRHHTFLQGS